MNRLIDFALGYAAGVGLGLTFPGPGIFAWGFVGLLPLATLSRGGLARLAWALFAALCGYVRVPLSEPPPVPEASPCERVFVAETLEESTTVSDRERVSLGLMASSECVSSYAPPTMSPASGRVFLTVGQPLSRHLHAGTVLRLRGRLQQSLSPRNPGMPARTGEFLSLNVPGPEHLLVLSGAKAQNPSSWLWPARQRLERHFDGSLGPREAAVARALTLGQGKAVAPSVRAAFRRTGAAHLLAVSGLHLSFAAMVIFGAFSFCLARVELVARRFDTGRFAAAGAIAAAGAYACLSGGHIPAVRAFVMVAAVLGGRLTHRPSSSQSGLALAALGILASDPKSLFEASFQLSFGAAAVLVLLLTRRQRLVEAEAEAETGRPSPVARWVEGLWRLGRASLAATAVTTPIALWHFGELSLVAVPVNLVVVPMASMVLVPGLLLCCALVPVWPWAANTLTRLCGELLGLLLDGLIFLSRYPVAVARPGPWVLACVLAACGAGLALAVWPKKVFALSFAITCGVFALASNLSADTPPSGALVLDVFDVGHGDSMLVSLPEGPRILVDTGGSRNPEYDVGERIVLPALSALGISFLDALVLSHEDHDHAGGAAAVLRRLKVSRLWHNGAANPSQAQTSALVEAVRRQVLVEAPPDLCGVRRMGKTRISVIHPCDPHSQHDLSSANDRSLVLLVEHGVGRLLLLGDIGGDVERQLVRQGRIPRVDVLKVAHHGSRSSSTQELLDAAAPRYAVVSEPRHEGRVGLHPEAGQRLRAHGAVVLSTRERGAMRIALDFQGISVRPL